MKTILNPEVVSAALIAVDDRLVAEGRHSTRDGVFDFADSISETEGVTACVESFEAQTRADIRMPDWNDRNGGKLWLKLIIAEAVLAGYQLAVDQGAYDRNPVTPALSA